MSNPKTVKTSSTNTVETKMATQASKSPLVKNKNKTSKTAESSGKPALLNVKDNKPSPKGSPMGSRNSSNRSTPISRQGSPGSSDSDLDQPDAKTGRRKSSPKHVVSLNLKSKNNPLHPDKVLEGILPGGRPKILYEYDPSTSKSKNDEPKSRGSTPEKDDAERTPSPKHKPFDDDEEFRQKVKKMDYNTVFMLAQRTKGPQQYKYRKILQEMYDEQNKS